jgi:uncharacterized protein
MTVVRRHAEKALEVALSDTRVVVVVGARQVGKSTLVKLSTSGMDNVTLRRLDRPTDLAAAREDPEGFVVHDGLLVIDEIQREPNLVLPIKARVDDSDRPGQFLLTGSARLLGLRSLPDSLVGRSETIELWPFSQGELAGCVETFLDAAFSPLPLPKFESRLRKVDYLERAIAGGYPEAVKRQPGRRQKFFDNYINDLIDRDITQLSEIQRRPDLIRLLSLLAARMATPLSIQNVAEDLGIPKSTVDRYVTLLEEVFIVKRVPGWANSATKRATQRSKLVMIDSGLAAFLVGFHRPDQRNLESLVGPLIENFVIGELMRQATWSETILRAYHYRDRDNREIDLVLESSDGTLVGVEVKAGMTIRAEDFRHLTFLRDALGDRFRHGLVFYSGADTLHFGDRLTALPISSLWADDSEVT